MDHTENMMFDLLRDQFTENHSGLPISPDDTVALYRLAKKHELAHIIGNVLEKRGVLKSSPLAFKYETQLFDAHYRCERYQYAYRELCFSFDKAQISYIPLKGLIQSSFYPESWMRTSCDMDILVHKNDLENVKNILTHKLNYRIKSMSAHDIACCSDDGVCIELHYDLVEKNRAASAHEILEHVWEYSSPLNERKYMYVMCDSMLYFYHIAHMAKHFENGGCGIRMFLDLWLMEQKRNFWNNETVTMLKRGGLFSFAVAARNLAASWFGGADLECDLAPMQKYILGGGIYGSTSNQYSVRRYRSRSKLRYILSRIFISYDELKYQYPLLIKHRWMFPVYWTVRCLSFISGSRVQKRKNTLNTLNSISNKQVEEVSQLLESLGL